jgi:hypothetical protein
MANINTVHAALKAFGTKEQKAEANRVEKVYASKDLVDNANTVNTKTKQEIQKLELAELGR